MAANSDGSCDLTTVVTCEGDLSDPGFPSQLDKVVGRLNGLLGEVVKVRKLEPWNSVRVTLSIPREAALRLRQLANEGSQQLRALGILSVQVEGDQVISLRLATNSVDSNPQEIIIRTAQDGPNNERQDSDLGLSRFLSSGSSSSASSSGANAQVQFKSPNVVCPPDSVVPKVGSGSSTPTNNVSNSGKAYGGPFPFASMNQAIHSNREGPFNSLPPPYPGKHPPVTISSPLLVNLLQNDGAKEQSSGPKLQTTVASAARPLRTPPVSVQKTVTVPVPVSVPTTAPTLVKPNPATTTQANVLVNNSISPSALSTNTSIRQNSTVMTSTTVAVANTPPPQYHRPTPLPIPVQHQPGMHISAASTSHSNSQSQNNTSLPQHMTLPQPNLPLPQSTHPLSQTSQPSTQPVISATASNISLPQSKPNNIPLPMQHKININNIPVSQANAAASLMQPSLFLPQNSNNPLSQTSVNLNQSYLNNVLSRSLPSPPSYSVATSRPPWDALVHNTPLLDLTPTLTDLKADDLDELLPPLERELSHSPLPDLPEELTTRFAPNHNTNQVNSNSTAPVEDKRKFLINPLTGELEPHSSGESDAEEPSDVFTGLPSPAALSDDDTSSTTRPDTTTDQSDTETRSSDTSKHARLKNSKVRERGRDSPALKPTEKIKLRLKLEKSEPINSAYKVDVSFINTQPKKASASIIGGAEEPRVPPLHISLRGRNSVVIKNKSKLNPDGSPMKPKARKNQEHAKLKKDGNAVVNNEEAVNSPNSLNDATIDPMKAKFGSFEPKKAKKFKSNHEHKDLISLTQESDLLKSKLVIHNHYKDKQKERRGSDSDLVRSSKKYLDSNGIVTDEKKRRLSQTEPVEGDQPAVLGSTNVGTIMGLPQKPRKDKIKLKDGLKSKDASRNKLYSKNLGDKLASKQVTLPTAGEIDMEAKFKQGLLEGTGEKGVPRPPHRTEVVHHLMTENNRIENPEKVVKTLSDPASLKDKSPEPDKCNTPDRKSVELGEKQSTVTGSRSPPNSGSAGQGEDSGIESMDALSEKSPNQASQSPHADIIPPKTQVPDMLDIEAQLAKMEGLNGDIDRGGVEEVTGGGVGVVEEDVNENKHHLDQTAKLKQCCELTCALQDSLKQGSVTISTGHSTVQPPPLQQAEVSLVPLKVKKEEDLEPLPVRVTPALYTYSNPDKSRGGSESPSLSDEDSNSCSTNSTLHSRSKSLLEQLLIEIPSNDHQGVPSSPSPATRSSVRTRALSKLNSPELNSPVAKNLRAVPTTKRKRNESDSSNHSVDEARNKKRKCSENAVELIKACRGVDPNKLNNVKKAGKLQQDESSDSDEPLIEKLRKNPPTAVNANVTTANVNNVAKNKVKGGTGVAANNNKSVVSTRRSVRSNMPAQNTRSKGDKLQCESEALRRKTRSAVTDVESKRKKELK